MNRTLKSLRSEAQNIRLTDEERLMGRMGMSHMFAIQPHTGPGRHWYARPTVVATILCFVTLGLTGGGIALAAENTVPGDSLYPIKIHVNEGIKTVLNMSPQARARWEVRRLERRLEEVETLVQRKKGQGKGVATAVEVQAKRLQKQIERLHRAGESEAAENVGEDVAASLNAHKQVLSGLTKDENEGSVGHEVIRSIRVHQQSSDKQNSRPNTAQAAAGKQRAAQNKINEVKFWLTKISDRFETALVTTANDKVAAAQAAWDEGKQKLAEEKYSEAFQLFQKAHRLAQEAKVFLVAQQRLQNQSRNNKSSEDQAVNIQASVPIKLFKSDKP